MAVLSTSCGHCDTERIGLLVIGYARSRRGIAAFTICPKCSEPAAHVLRQGHGSTATEQWYFTANAKAEGVDAAAKSGWQIAASYPQRSEPQAPDHCPDDIARIYIGAKSALKRGELDGAGMLIRKVLEVATKRVLAAASGPLASRIDAMATANLIPDAVKDWAHQIRVIGNDAAHEADEPPREEVEEAVEFVDAFLIYVFTMPERVRLRRSKTTGTP